MVRIKICGITRVEDAMAAAEAGADAIGLVFADSPRRVSTRQAREIVASLPPLVSAVGVFVNSRAATILRTASVVGFSTVQLHGDEPPGLVGQLGGMRVIKAMSVRSKAFVDDVRRFADAGVCGVLLDAFNAKARGGTGVRFNWDHVYAARKAGALEGSPPIIFAGGLTAANVAAGIRRIRPWAVDVSTGVESSPGIKDAESIARFVAAVRKSRP
jgi:phosphoribosylanthranilate isomerase